MTTQGVTELPIILGKMSSVLNDIENDIIYKGADDMLTNIDTFSKVAYQDKLEWICKNCKYCTIENRQFGICHYEKIPYPNIIITGENIQIKVKLTHYCNNHYLNLG